MIFTPSNLNKILAANPKAHTIWKNLTPIAQRDFMSWINSAKQEETRKRRMESVPSRLLSGKRRPCCYNLVPMGLYKTLGESSKAKAQWKTLTPDERRDFIDWIDTAKEPKEHQRRIAQTCVMLAKGKKSP